MPRSLWVLDFYDELEAVTIQPLGGPGPSSTSGGGGSSSGGAAVQGGTGLGEAVVLRGQRAACGFPPACQLTVNPHLAISLTSLTPVSDCWDWHWHRQGESSSTSTCTASFNRQLRLVSRKHEQPPSCSSDFKARGCSRSHA